MRKVLAALLGLPVLGALYLAPLARRPATLRTGLALVAVLLLSAAAVNTSTRPVTAHLTPTADPAATVRLAAPLVTDFRVHQAVTFDFTAPMDEASVAAALSIDPITPLHLSWSTDGRHLAVGPQQAWIPSQLYAVRIGTSAHDRSGQAIGGAVSATFLTRGRPSATLALIGATGPSALPDHGVDITFNEPVEQASVRNAFSVSPAAAGRIVSMTETDPAAATFVHYQWLPAEPLTAGAHYTFSLAASVDDADGVTMATPVVLATSTLSRPAILRSRPAAGSTSVPRDQVISIRFTTSMQRAATQAAFHVTGLASSAGTFAWYEGDTVMAWTPRSALAYGTTYTVSIDGTAVSAAGVAMADGASPAGVSFGFRTEAKPAPTPKPAPPTTRPVPRPTNPPTTSSPWYSVELYYLNLLNCTHTGGWVHSDGSCTGRGSNGNAPLKLSSGISNCATRPWARYLAVNGLLEHNGGSPYTTPGDRLRRCGYSNYEWGENLGQWSGNAYTGALQVVLFFQSEKSYNGGHWVNLMNGNFHYAGIGIWIAGGRAVYNSDFYGG